MPDFSSTSNSASGPAAGEGIPFESVLIFGMGMMGASLALALRDHPVFAGRVSGVVRSEKSAALIREQGLADEVFRVDTRAAASTESGGRDGWPAGLPDPSAFDLVVLGLPVGAAVEMLPTIEKFTGVITDMSSTGAVARRAEDFADLRFVGAHPMCGSEDTGPGAARAGLFQDRLCLILDRTLRAGAGSAPPPTYDSDRDQVERLWRAVGMQTFRVDADRHDEIVGYLSHGPHVISGLLTNWARGSATVADALSRSPLPITGGGFKDMARIAGSNPEMWYEILDTNRGPVAGSLREFSAQLESLIDKLEAGAGDDADRDFWYEWFNTARKDRDFLCGYDER